MVVVPLVLILCRTGLTVVGTVVVVVVVVLAVVDMLSFAIAAAASLCCCKLARFIINGLSAISLGSAVGCGAEPSCTIWLDAT